MTENNRDREIVNHDGKRVDFTGVPECILGEPKDNDQLTLAVQHAIKNNESVLITRILKNQILALQNLSSKYNIALVFDKYQRTAVMGNYDPKLNQPANCALISAGTSDDYLVEEIGFCLNYFGVGYSKFSDIGVAGIHRHKTALTDIHNQDTIRCIIVVAGQEGALFPVIAAQTKLPLIAVPSSVGYGFGGKGLTALQSALQSCSPGVTVVNIDNGFGAAAFVKKMINLFQ
ncbi:MAG: nickel pincer cofactor biosynthesis protein LarB [Candidatus Heimdallarchaeota archaeon]|nr:nickel pincer cofactor biosynthesis protein LarB [Candidatus Heimdallarchaeota archaeon]